MKTVTISVNWQDQKSIAKAERQKSKLENQGYSLVKENASHFTSTLTYQKV